MQPWLKRLLWGVPLMAIIIVALGAVLMWLWNWLVPAIFEGPSINLIEAIGLLVMGRLLTGMGSRGTSWSCNKKQAWKRTWASLSTAEKQALQEKYKHRCRATAQQENQPTDVQ